MPRGPTLLDEGKLTKSNGKHFALSLSTGAARIGSKPFRERRQNQLFRKAASQAVQPECERHDQPSLSNGWFDPLQL